MTQDDLLYLHYNRKKAGLICSESKTKTEKTKDKKILKDAMGISTELKIEYNADELLMNEKHVKDWVNEQKKLAAVQAHKRKDFTTKM